MNKQNMIVHARPRGRPSGISKEGKFDRSEELASAALSLFASRNFASVTIKQIAKAANVNTALIYYYFNSKSDLFRAAIEYAIDQAFRDFRQLQCLHDSPVSTIDSWLNNHVQLFAPIHKFVKISMDYSSSDIFIPSIEKQISHFYNEEKTILSCCINEGINKNLFADVDPEGLAIFISTYLDGAMIKSIIHKDFNLPEAIEMLRHCIWAQLRHVRLDENFQRQSSEHISQVNEL